MGLWRCQNEKCSEDAHGRCIFDFEADKPICPKCGSNGSIRGARSSVIKRERIHYDPPGDQVVEGFLRGKNESACTPGKPFKGMATGEASAVTCPACKKTAVWLEAMGQSPAPVVAEGSDLSLAVDLAAGMFREEAG